LMIKPFDQPEIHHATSAIPINSFFAHQN